MDQSPNVSEMSHISKSASGLHNAIWGETTDTDRDVMEQRIAGGHFGFTGVTPASSKNVRGHFGSPDILGRRTT